MASIELAVAAVEIEAAETTGVAVLPEISRQTLPGISM